VPTQSSRQISRLQDCKAARLQVLCNLESLHCPAGGSFVFAQGFLHVGQHFGDKAPTKDKLSDFVEEYWERRNQRNCAALFASSPDHA
jgi:hypothetical protein